jgi:hypothetical protein
MAFILIGLCAVIGAWLLSSLLMGSVGPWGKLAKKYPAISTPQQWYVTMLDGTVGFGSYRNALKIAPQEDGLHLATSCLYLWHPPIFIPWGAIQSSEVRSVFGSQGLVLNVGDPTITTIKLPISELKSSSYFQRYFSVGN